MTVHGSGCECTVLSCILGGVAQPDTLPGDVILVLQQKEHATFKRKGNDLFVEKEISLTEALCGYQFVIQHLDGRQVSHPSHPSPLVARSWASRGGHHRTPPPLL